MHHHPPVAAAGNCRGNAVEKRPCAAVCDAKFSHPAILRAGMHPFTGNNSESRRALAWGVPLIALGLLLRVGLALVSWGSNDATTWEHRAWRISHLGVIAVYPLDRDFNHPPLTGYWAGIAYRLSHPAGGAPVPPRERQVGFNFSFIFKQVDVVADAISCWLLWKILSPRRGATFAIAAAAYVRRRRARRLFG